jgi:hypothetical protein
MMLPGSANFAGMNEAQRNAIVQALLAQAQSGTPADGAASSAAGDPNIWPADPSDPASEGLADDGPSGLSSQGLGALGLGAIVGGPIASSVAQQGYSDTLGGLLTGHSPSVNAAQPGTGLGMAVTGYNSGYGQAQAAALADQAMTALGIYDAIDTSNAVNTAVEEGGYTSPSPTPDPGYTSPDPGSTIVGLPSDFTTSNASLATGPTGSGFDAGAAIAADVAGLSGLNAGVNDAVAGYDSSGNVDAGPGGTGEGGGGGDGGK